MTLEPGRNQTQSELMLSAGAFHKTGQAVCRRCGNDRRTIRSGQRVVFRCKHCDTLRAAEKQRDMLRWITSPPEQLSTSTVRVARKTHGLSHTPIYAVWRNMLGRCLRKTHKEYPRYGGRGIVICSEWLANPAAFFEWAVKSGYSQGLSIDRINNDGNYEPSNCRWVTQSVQSANSRGAKRNPASDAYSRYRGVTRNSANSFYANLCKNYVRFSSGPFRTEDEAAIAYNELAKKHVGSGAIMNIVKEQSDV